VRSGCRNPCSRYTPRDWSASDAGAERFTTVTVRPSVQSADPAQRQAYEKAAIAARNNCFIDRSIRGNIAYVVGGLCLSVSQEEYA
jgi:organic hydroperoxide reductase OsmC/OhrA